MTNPTTAKSAPKYPLLEELLASKGEALKGLYTNGDVAKLFGVSIRAIQDRAAKGQLISRDLPGRARFLPQDLEGFLVGSARKPDTGLLKSSSSISDPTASSRFRGPHQTPPSRS